MAQNFIGGQDNTLSVMESLVLEGLPEMGFLEGLKTRHKFKGFVDRNFSISDVFYIKSFSDKVLFPIDGFYGQNIRSLFTGDNSSSPVDVSGLEVFALDTRNRGLLKIAARTRKTIWEPKDNFAEGFAEEIAVKYGKVAIIDSFSKDENSLCSIYYPSFNKVFLRYIASREQGSENFEREISYFLRQLDAD